MDKLDYFIKEIFGTDIMEEDFRFANFHILLHSSLLSMENDICQSLRGIEYSRVRLSVTICFTLGKINHKERLARLQSEMTIGGTYDLNQCLCDIAEKFFREIERFKGCRSVWTVKDLKRLDVVLC